MIRKLLYISIFSIILQFNPANAGTEGSEELKKSQDQVTANECHEGLSRAMFKFNHTLDGAIFEPVARGYRSLPAGLIHGTSNVVNNLRSLLTLSNNVLQGDFKKAGNTAGRFAVNSTLGVLGIWDPATKLGLEDHGKEDFGQTIGTWGASSGCYFVLPFLGPTTARDAVGLVGNMFLDPLYQVTHNTEVMNRSYSEHNFWYYRGASSIDFRAKNIESWDSLEKNSIDLYASLKSLYLQNRNRKISNSTTTVETQNDSDWEEIDID
jgi:phospholipid-binding lipoprotein MlaA